MADPGLVQALDFILNRSDEASIDVLTEAVNRRRRDLTIFSAIGGMPDPQKMAKEITEKIDAGIGGGIETMRKSIQDMIIKILHEHAPELNEKQIDELCQAWLPDRVKKQEGALPPDVLLSMIEQFVSFSHGEMPESTDRSLREEIGSWPERYWKAFPPVIRQIVSDYLKNKISDSDFKSKILLALGL
ncbi:MAG: hypothetical protein FWB83_04170 [Treponema sp.]|nr:hypothetical protein [Treponema sp.]